MVWGWVWQPRGKGGTVLQVASLGIALLEGQHGVGQQGHQEGLHQAQLQEGTPRLIKTLAEVFPAWAFALEAAVAAPAGQARASATRRSARQMRESSLPCICPQQQSTSFAMAHDTTHRVDAQWTDEEKRCT